MCWAQHIGGHPPSLHLCLSSVSAPHPPHAFLCLPLGLGRGHRLDTFRSLLPWNTLVPSTSMSSNQRMLLLAAWGLLTQVGAQEAPGPRG